jgi:hypothetical protein
MKVARLLFINVIGIPVWLFAMKTELLIDNAQEKDCTVQIQKAEVGNFWERLCDIESKTGKELEISKFWFIPLNTCYSFLTIRIITNNTITNSLSVDIKENDHLRCTLNKINTKSEVKYFNAKALQNASLLRIKLFLRGEQLSESTVDLAFLSE